MVCREPPEEIQQVWPWNFRNAVPGHPRQVEVLHPLAVEVDIEILREPRSPFGNPPLGAMAFVDERGNNSEDGLRRSHLILVRDPHRLTPPLQDEQTPHA